MARVLGCLRLSSLPPSNQPPNRPAPAVNLPRRTRVTDGPSPVLLQLDGMSPAPIPIKPKSHYDTVSEGAALLSCSYLSSSPIAQEIIASDLAQCLDDYEHHNHHRCGDGRQDWDSDSKSEFDPDSLDVTLAGPLISQPSGVAYGTLRPTIAPNVLGTPALNPRDLVQSRMEERSLLRDNHILPPKHPRPFEESSWKRLYRRLFSTKVPASIDHDVFGPTLSRVSTKALESTPLLQDSYTGPYSPTPSEQQFQWDAACAANIIKTTWQREAQTLTQYSRSLIVTFLLHYSVTVTSVFTVGRIGRLELGAVSLATMTANITCYAPIQGLSTCLDTLCAQAYGSGHKHLVGLQLQRMTYLLWMLLLPIVSLWWYSERVLSSIIPDPDTAALAGLYLRVLILGTPGVAAFESGKRFVQAQGLFHATTFVLLIGAPLNIVANWFFVWKLELGFSGAAGAVVFTQNLLPFLLFLYVRFVEGMECWNGLSRRAFSNWGELPPFPPSLRGTNNHRPNDQARATWHDHGGGAVFCLRGPNTGCQSVRERSSRCPECSGHSYLNNIQHPVPPFYCGFYACGQPHRR